MNEELHYVRNADLLPEVMLFKKTGVISERLGGMLLLIAKNLSNKSNFINYTWKEDMVQEGVLTCCKYLKNFDPDKSNNPFAYITMICSRSFVGYISKQKRHSVIKDKCFSFREMIIEDDTMAITSKAIDYTVIARERYVCPVLDQIEYGVDDNGEQIDDIGFDEIDDLDQEE